jgi:voltage-gated potassium channel Kch
MYLVAIVEVLLWGAAYLVLGIVEGLEKAIYFSAVTFTTLGYGDVVLDGSRRLLSAIEAVNGIIMFGWSTAIVIAVVQRVYSRQEAD